MLHTYKQANNITPIFTSFMFYISTRNVLKDLLLSVLSETRSIKACSGSNPDVKSLTLGTQKKSKQAESTIEFNTYGSAE